LKASGGVVGHGKCRQDPHDRRRAGRCGGRRIVGRLRHVSLVQSRVTDAGVQKLNAELPGLDAYYQ
jgi:hypothetical protein